MIILYIYVYIVYTLYSLIEWSNQSIVKLLGRWIRWRVDSFILEPGNWRQSHAVQNLIKENRSEYDFNLASWHFHQHFPPSLELASYPPNPMLSFFPKKNSPLGMKAPFPDNPSRLHLHVGITQRTDDRIILGLVRILWWNSLDPNDMMGNDGNVHIYIYCIYYM